VESLTSGEVIAAAAKNDLAKLKKAIEAGTNLDTSDHDGRTALHAAAAAGHLDAVRLLLDAHAHPALQDTMGLTPLFMACAKV
jgi:ankyrin repeat protein